MALITSCAFQGLMDCESAFYTFDLSTVLAMLRPVSG